MKKGAFHRAGKLGQDPRKPAGLSGSAARRYAQDPAPRLRQSLNPWSLSISMNLLYSLTPLFLCLGHRLAIFRKLTFNYRREIFLRKNLQLQNVAMLTGIMLI